MVESEKHEEKLRQVLEKLNKEGYRAFDLERKSPDAIALKDNKIYAVEVLGRQYKKGKGWTKKWTYLAKKKVYHMFDDILIYDFKYPIKKGGDTPTLPMENERH